MAIRLRAVLSLLDRQGAVINNATSNKPNNNISQALDTVIDVKHSGSNPFILGGASRLGDGSTFESKNSINYFIGDYLSNSNGDFTTPYIITISGENLNHFNIVFDNYNNAYPTKIKVNGNYIENDDTDFTASNLTGNTHSVVIENWSIPKQPLRIQGIFVGLDIIVNERNLIEMWTQRSDRSDNNQPSYGIISNIGFIKFLDFNGEVRDYVKQKLLKSDLSVKMYIENTLFRDNFTKSGLLQDHSKMQLIANLSTDKWDYDSLNFEVSVDCKDGLEEWQEIFIRQSSLLDNKTAMDLFNELKQQTPSTFVFEPLDQKTIDRLKSIKIENYFFDEKTLWTLFDELCQLALLHIYKNHNGNVVVLYHEGN